jgi:hypothetical protein
MSEVIAQTDSNFEFGDPEIEGAGVLTALAEPTDPLGPLVGLLGGQDVATWTGNGFNAIWRPHPLAQGGPRPHVNVPTLRRD